MKGQGRGRPTVAVAGLGLVGGSIARGLTRAGWRVLGVDRRAATRRALAAGAVRQAFTSLAAAARQAQVVVLAAPPDVNIDLLRRLAALDPPPPVITDVGSVKGPICAKAVRFGLPAFVGGHPMAGRERGGFAASSPDLFRGRPWVLVHGRQAGGAAKVVRSLVRALGGHAVAMGAAEHDRAVAYLSHLPQLVAWALLAAARTDPVASRHLAVAGPGFADMTRLAGSPRALWEQILAQNRPQVARALRAFRAALSGTARPSP